MANSGLQDQIEPSVFVLPGLQRLCYEGVKSLGVGLIKIGNECLPKHAACYLSWITSAAKRQSPDAKVTFYWMLILANYSVHVRCCSIRQLNPPHRKRQVLHILPLTVQGATKRLYNSPGLVKRSVGLAPSYHWLPDGQA